MEDTRIYTGVTKYKDIDFTFVFNGENLRLIPTTENVRKVETEWLMTPIAKGTFIPNTDLKMEDGFHCISWQGECYYRWSAKILIFDIATDVS